MDHVLFGIEEVHQVGRRRVRRWDDGCDYWNLVKLRYQLDSASRATVPWRISGIPDANPESLGSGPHLHGAEEFP